MGAVYRAHDAVLDRDVAVKLLSESGLGTEGRERMLREAQAIAKLNHPNIAQGDLSEARLALEEVITEAGGQPIDMSQAGYGLAQAELAVAEQNWEAARRAYAESVEFQGRVGLCWYRTHTLLDWAEALIAEGERRLSEEARALLNEARDEFEACGAPIYAEQIRARLSELGPE